jgi:transcriptional regulator with XRE-family HTH domain
MLRQLRAEARLTQEELAEQVAGRELAAVVEDRPRAPAAATARRLVPVGLPGG